MLKKQELKILVASDMSDFNQNDTFIYLDKISRRHYDMIIVIGDISQALLTTFNSQFDSALIVLLPKTHKNYFDKTDGIEYFNLKKYHFSSSGIIMGYGSEFDNKKPVPIYQYEKYLADVLISSYPPKFINMSDTEAKEDKVGHNEINLYAAYHKPKYIIHGGRKNNKETILENGTKICSVHGLKEFQIEFKK